MKQLLVFFALSLSFCACAQNQAPPTLKSILLEQLRTTHNVKDWFGIYVVNSLSEAQRVECDADVANL
jgi:hypothetical protein